MSTELPDLNLCEQERIHVPAAIQPHGVLFALNTADDSIIEVSASVLPILGFDPNELAGQPLARAFGPRMRSNLEEARNRFRQHWLNPSSFQWRLDASGCEFSCYVHEYGTRTILEMEPSLEERNAYADQMNLAMHAFQSLHQHQRLLEKLQVAAKLTRRFSGYDRVMIYRFDQSWNGEVIAESSLENVQPYLGLHYPASDIPEIARQLYLINRNRVIVDMHYQPSPLIRKDKKTSTTNLSLSILRSVSPIHCEYMQNMGVRATFVSSLVVDDKLWGLIACHHDTPKRASRFSRDLFTWLSRDLSSQIALCEQQQEQLYAKRLSRCRQRVINRLREGASMESVVGETTQSDILDMVGAEGAALVSSNGAITSGVTPPIPVLKTLIESIGDYHDGHIIDGVFCTNNLSKHCAWAFDYRKSAAGALQLSLPGELDTVIWFRGEKVRHVTWGGNPDKPVTLDQEGRLSPRKSFDAWKKTVTGKAIPWLKLEIESAREFSRQMTQELGRIRETEIKLLQQSITHLNDGVIVVQHTGMIRSMNQSAITILGLPVDYPAVGRAAIDMLRLRDETGQLIPEHEHPVTVNLTHEEPYQNRQYQITTSRGEPRWISLNSNPIITQGTAAKRAVLISFRNITNELALQRKLSQLSITDPLTGLPNRAHFRERLISALQHAKLKMDVIGVMIIDLDHFKDINESLDHRAGDHLLREVARRLGECVLTNGTIARLGGDEFAVFTQPCDSLEPILLLAHRICSMLRVPFYFKGTELHTSGSVGVATAPIDGQTAEELMRQADIAMYAAKRDNIGGVKIYTAQLGASVQNHMTALARLRRALELDQFELYYQPKANVVDGKVQGMEALIRWRDDDGHIIMPEDFIPLAETSGLIEPMSNWVIRQAVRDLHTLTQHGFDHISIAINLSGKHFKNPFLALEIQRLMEQYKLKPERLEIEITETLLMEDNLLSIENLRKFAVIGIRVSIDDFGTGYSSLAYLRRFQVSTLKIDRSFVTGCTGNDDQRKITYAIVSMAHSLDLRTIAEGVETREELRLLQELQCDEYQGYYLSRPKTLSALLHDRSSPLRRPVFS